MSYKDTGINNPGTSIKYGADDLEKISRLLNGVTTGVGGPLIKTTDKWGIWDNVLYFRNQADTKNTTIRGQTNSPSTDVTLTLPPIPTNDTLPALGLSQTWALKQQMDSGLTLKQMTAPSNPSSSYHHMYVASNGHLIRRNSSGAEVDYDAVIAGLVDMKDGSILARDFIRVFKVSSTYYAINGDGTVISTSTTNPATVIQAAIDYGAAPLPVYIDTVGDTQSWNFQAGFTGINLRAYGVLYLTGTSNLFVPAGYTGALFKITGAKSNIQLLSDGGYGNEQATASRNWVLVQIGVGDSTDNIDNCVIKGFLTYQSGDVVKINQGSTGTIESILIDGMGTDDTRRFITWNVSDATKVKDVVVQNCRPLLDGGSVTDCFKDVKGTRTTFIANIPYGVQGSTNEMNIASGAVNTMVFGGSHTGVVGTFTDLGTDTYIDDAKHTEWKLKGTAVSPTAISSDQNNYNPSGWSDNGHTLRVSASGAQRMITGLVPGSNPKNRIVRLVNIGTTFNIMLPTESTSSTAANRFKFVADTMLMPNQAITLFYDTIDSRWRPVADSMSLHAMQNVANIFTAIQTIKLSGVTDFLTLYRPENTIGNNADLNFDFNDSISTQVTYCDLRATIVDPTDGSEDGKFAINLINAGTKVTSFEFTNDGNIALFNPSNVASDDASLQFKLRDSAANTTTYGELEADIVTNTDTVEVGRFRLYCMNAGTLRENLRINGDGELEVYVASGQSNTMILRRETNGGGNTNNLNFEMRDSASNNTTYGRIDAEIVDATDTSEDGKLEFSTMDNGSLLEKMILNSNGDLDILAGKTTIIRDANSTILDLYRTDKVAGNQVNLNFYLEDSADTKQQYSQLTSEIVTNTAGSEDGKFIIANMIAGTLRNCFTVREQGDIEVYKETSSNGSEWATAYFAKDSAANRQLYANTGVILDDSTSTSEDSSYYWDLFRAGSQKRVAKLGGDGDLLIGLDTTTQGLRYSVIGCLSDTSNDVVISNSASETTLLSETIKGGMMGPDAQLYIRLSGTLLQNQATGTTYTLRIKVGGTTIYSDVFGGTIAQSAVEKPWMLELRFMPANQSGTSGRLSGFATMNDTTAATTGIGSIADDEQQVNANFRAAGISWTFANDTTVAVTMQMSVANASTTFTMDGYELTFYHD